MPANTAQILAILADDAYSDTPVTGLPSGFTPFDLPGLNMSDGFYRHGNGAAAVAMGVLDGQSVLVVAFRGSDSTHDWVSDVVNIDDSYVAYKPLVAAIEQYSAAGGKVVLTGHSAGGTMAQIFMSEHLGDDHYRAVTFGSPGALSEKDVFSAHADSRITNYAVSDDPIVYLGAHRAEAIAAIGKGIGGVLTGVLGEVGHLQHVSLHGLGGPSDGPNGIAGDYVNNGIQVVLAGAQPSLTLDQALHGGLSEHEPETYVALTGAPTVFEPHLW